MAPLQVKRLREANDGKAEASRARTRRYRLRQEPHCRYISAAYRGLTDDECELHITIQSIGFSREIVF
jgi:hypothetical protein